MPNSITYDTNRTGNQPRIMSLPVASGTVFQKGEVLIWTATGLNIVASATNYAPVSDTTRIAGVANDGYLNPITGVAYTTVEIIVAEPGTRFCFPLYHATPASAVLALTNLGKAYELRRSTTAGTPAYGYPQVDISSTPDSTNGCARIMEPTLTDDPAWVTAGTPAGVNYQNVYVEFKPSACQFSGGR